jgi:hypothetical protein
VPSSSAGSSGVTSSSKQQGTKEPLHFAEQRPPPQEGAWLPAAPHAQLVFLQTPMIQLNWGSA